METWFLNHVLGLSLLLLLLVGLPRPLGAGTPANNSSDPGSYHSTPADEVGSVENNVTSSSYSSESLSPSQRNLLTHTAAAARGARAGGGNFDTEETQTLTETSSRSLEISLSTEPLPSTSFEDTTEASSSYSGTSSGTSSSSSSGAGTSSGRTSSTSTGSSTSGSSTSDTSSGRTRSTSTGSSTSGSSTSDTSSGRTRSTSTGSSTSGSSTSDTSSGRTSGTSSGRTSSTSTGSITSGGAPSGSSTSDTSSGRTSGTSGTSGSSTSDTSDTSSGSGTSRTGTSGIGTSDTSTGSSTSGSSTSDTSSGRTSSTSTGSSTSDTSSGRTSSTNSGTSGSSTSGTSGSSTSDTSSGRTSSTSTGSGTSDPSSVRTSSTNSGTSGSGTSGSSTSGRTSSTSSGTSGSGTSGRTSSTNSGTSGSGTSGSSTSGRTSSTSTGSSTSDTSSGRTSSTNSGTSGSSTSGSSTSGSSTSGRTSSTSSGSGSSTSDTSSSSSWKDLGITDLAPGVSHPVSWKDRSSTLTEDASLSRDILDTTLRLQDATALASQRDIITDSTYTSSAISRAGERTLLSVTSSSGNSTSSSFTEDSNSHQPASTWRFPAEAKETEVYTHSAPPTQTDSGDSTDEHMTQSFKGTFSETGSPEGSRGTQSLTEPPNATWHRHTPESEETSDSTPPLRVTELSTDQSDVLVSSTPPVTSPAGGPTAMSGTASEAGSDVGTSTEASQSFSTRNQEGAEGLSSQTREESTDPGSTTAPPTVRGNTHGMDDFLTDAPVPVTEVSFHTTTGPVTERPQTTEEATFKASTSSTPSTTVPPLPATSAFPFSSTVSSSTPESLTESTYVPYATPPATASTPAPPTSAVRTTRRTSSSTATESPYPTKGTTLPSETGTAGATTSSEQDVTTTNAHSTPTRSSEVLHTTGRQSGRGTTELVVTTSPTPPTHDIQPTKAPPPPRNPCLSNPCMNGGMCVSYKRHQFTCHCQQAWTGPTCTQDMDECEKDPCPAGSRCVNTRGSFSCECALGFDLEDGRTCTRAKTFLGTFSFNRLPQDPVIFKSSTMHEIQREIIQLLNASLSVLRGYTRSTLSKKEEDGLRIFAVNMFSISTDVTSAEVHNSIQMSLSNCSSSTAHCRMVLHHQLTYHAESLCKAQKSQCDKERSMCTDGGGTAYCQCLQGYYKHNPEDLTCLECGDGYKLENSTCVPCTFGFGGFNCGNFYKLIAVVVSPTGGAMLLILVIALIVTCCRKDKNDINKIIFKSGDLQMSPYADFPKNNRISMEWGRETIEMQENGSTKNLLQMTDIYYSPALRNADLERNGLYPFTGLPGSRHSCIYPAQWNPSFISDDSRRRDYF